MADQLCKTAECGLPDHIVNANEPLIPHDHPFFKPRTREDDARDGASSTGSHLSSDGGDVPSYNAGCAMRWRQNGTTMRLGDDAMVRNAMGVRA